MSSQRLADAFEYAAALHAGQKRKGEISPTSPISWRWLHWCSRTAETKIR